MSRANDLSELVTLLHSVSTDGSKWPDFLQCLSIQTQSVTATVLSQQTGSAELSAIAAGGLDPNAEAQKSYNQHFCDQDPYFAAAALGPPPTGVIVDQQMVPRSVLKKGIFYNEFLQPFGLEHGVMLPLLTPGATDLIALWRNPRQGPLEGDTLRLLDELLPNIRWAFAFRRALDGANFQLDQMRSMLYAVSLPAVLLDAQGKLLLMNSSAETILRAQDGIQLQGLRLRAASRDAQKRLQALMVASVAETNSHEGQWRGVSLPRPSGKRDLQALVCPVRPPGQTASATAQILVVLRDPAEAAGISAYLLRDLYGFSPAETSVANALLEGLSPEQISRRRHVSSGTVRNQVKSILAKSGTRSQADLLRSLASLPKDRRPSGNS